MLVDLAEMHAKVLSENAEDRLEALRSLTASISDLSKEDPAWQDLIKLVQDKDRLVQIKAIHTLSEALVCFPDKQYAWQIVFRLIQNGDFTIRIIAANFLGDAICYHPDKMKAWQDILKLTQDNDRYVQSIGVRVLGESFCYIPDKSQAWQILLGLVRDTDVDVRGDAAYALGEAFSYILDKVQAWQVLLGLLHDEEIEVLWKASEALVNAFGQIPGKSEAWQILISLTQNENSIVRLTASEALEICYHDVPNKVQASQDLFKLTLDEKPVVRMGAAQALGIAFSQVAEREQVWQNLSKLSQDKDNYVRMYAYHSLAKSCIFRATESVEDYSFQKDLEEAIDFFEKASKETNYTNPAKFCLPFYRSFRALTFQEANAEDVIEKYFKEAKTSVQGSDKKWMLLNVVQDLSYALKNVKKAREASIEERKIYLDAMRQYCEKAASLMAQTSECTPLAVEILRRGFPLINQEIKNQLLEIGDESGRLQTIARETPFEPLSRRAYEITKKLPSVEYRVDAEDIMDCVILDIQAMCAFLPDQARESIGELQNWRDLDFAKKMPLFIRAISHCSNRMEELKKEVDDRDQWIEYLRNSVIARLDNINYNIFKLNIRSSNASHLLQALLWEIEKLVSLKFNMDRLDLSLESLKVPQQQVLCVLEAEMPRITNELKGLCKDRKDPEVHKILEKLDALETPNWKTILDVSGVLISIISLIKELYPAS